MAVGRAFRHSAALHRGASDLRQSRRSGSSDFEVRVSTLWTMARAEISAVPLAQRRSTQAAIGNAAIKADLKPASAFTLWSRSPALTVLRFGGSDDGECNGDKREGHDLTH